MHVIPLAPETAIATTARALSQTLTEALVRHTTILWLVSGGSSLDVAVQARDLMGPLTPAAGLHVGLIDERFGQPGHPDSNWQQLLDKGFDTQNVHLHPVLRGTSTMRQTAADYDKLLADLLAQTDLCVGLFGMGADAHTAGLLPQHPLMESASLVASYQGPDFARITITPAGIKRIDVALLYAVGETKWPALDLLANPHANVIDAPAKLLQSARDLRVYTDYRGDLT